MKNKLINNIKTIILEIGKHDRDEKLIAKLLLALHEDSDERGYKRGHNEGWNEGYQDGLRDA